MQHFDPLKTKPNIIEIIPINTDETLETNISFFSLDFPLLITKTYMSLPIAEAPANVNPDTTAKIVANATADMKPKNKPPPNASER